MSVFTQPLKDSGLPEAAIAAVRDALETAFTLTTETNAKIAALNAAKPKGKELPFEREDAIWKREAANGNKEFTADASHRLKLIDELEKVEMRLRTKAQADKYKLPEVSDDERSKMKSEVNAAKDTVATARQTAAAMAQMVDAMLEANGKGIEGGIISLLPELDSLKGSRGGRKGSGGSHATRANEITVNGETTNRMTGDRFKGAFSFAAQFISDKFNANEIPENEVTAHELEESYYASRGKGLREDKDDIPASHDWEFKREFFRKDGKGNKVAAPETLKMHHERWTQDGVAIPENVKTEK